MARYGVSVYGTDLYGPDGNNNLLWGIIIQWDDDGVLFSGRNEFSRCKGLRIERGRDDSIDVNNNTFKFPTVGRCTLTLDNYDGLYNAWNPSSPLYGYLEPGKFAHIYVVDGEGGTQYDLFSGTVKDIKPIGNYNEQVQIIIEDALQWLYDAKVDIDVQSSIRVDEAIQQILDDIAWPTRWGSSLEISTDTLTYWWAFGGNSAASEIADLTVTGAGYFSIQGDGTARYINRSSAAGSGISLSDENTLKQVVLQQPWEYYKNIVRVKFYPRVKQAAGVIWKLDTTPQIAASESLTVFGDYSYGTEMEIPALNVAISSSDYTANSAADGSGTDLTANISVTLTDFGTSAKLVVSNNGAVPAYITLLQVTGEAITVPNPGAIQEQLADYATKPRRFTLELPWQQDTNAAADIANILGDFLSTVRPYPMLQLENRIEEQFTPDLFETIYYASDKLGIADSFRVGKIEHEWLSETGQAVRTTFRLEPYVAGAIAWVFDVTDFGGSGSGGTVFG